MSQWFFLILSLLLGGVVGWLLSKRESIGAGFAALRASVGLMIGLSSSPVVAASVTAIFSLIGILIPIFFEQKTGAAPVALDSKRAEPQVPPLATWLFPFGGALLVGTLAGIALRANDALNFSSPNLRDHYRAQGFTEDQINSIMEQYARAITGPPPVTENKTHTSLQSVVKPVNWDDIWRENYLQNDNAEDNLSRIEAASPKEVKQAIGKMRQDRISAAAILDSLKKKFKPATGDHP
jgi:hypothetical protein